MTVYVYVCFYVTVGEYSYLFLYHVCVILLYVIRCSLNLGMCSKFVLDKFYDMFFHKVSNQQELQNGKIIDDGR